MISKIAWKNIWFKPLNTVLSVVLLTASVCIISVLVLLQKQFEEQFSSSMDDVDLVLGAKGSPLQLVLSSVYHIDAPPGNILYEEAEEWMQKDYVKKAIPLAYGDNYRGYKIVGTTEDYIDKYQAVIKEGKVFNSDFQVVIGANIANKLQLKIGDEFYGSHGDTEDGELHDHQAYTVVGILQPTKQLIDNLILSNISSVWNMHNHSHDEEEHYHEDGSVCTHHHDDEPKEITAVLLKLKNNMAKITWQRLIPQNTNMQAASPALEINRLFSMLGVGIEALKYLAYGIMLISGISIFVALYNTLKERKYEFALLRINGAKRWQLLSLVLIESVFLCIIGFLLGVVLSRVALYFISLSSEDEFKIAFNPYEFVWDKEGMILLITLLVGIIAALIPAVKAYKINISKTLSNA